MFWINFSLWHTHSSLFILSCSPHAFFFAFPLFLKPSFTCLYTPMIKETGAWSHSLVPEAAHVPGLGFLPSFIQNVQSTGVSLLDLNVGAEEEGTRAGGWSGPVVHVTWRQPLGESQSHTPCDHLCVRLMKGSRRWGMEISHAPEGQQTGKQVQRCFTHSITQKTHELMISTASSTVEMVTQGKLQISAEENVEGKCSLWSSECFDWDIWNVFCSLRMLM